jgi:hypothetical protein
MAQPVWTLSVDLQTKTATFQSGLADAAKSARGSFNEIKDGAREMGGATGVSMTEARHSVMLLGEEFGVHLPRALTTFIAGLGPIGAAMEAAFPFLAIVVGATLLLEHLVKVREEGAKLTESQINFGTAVNNVLNSLDEKLLTAGIRTDELNNNHLAGLNKQLELIDHQSMQELVQSFGVVAKAADVTFTQLKTSWYQWGAGSAGAKNALEQFKAQYDSLLAQGKDKEANDLLAGTRESAEKVLALQKQAQSNQTITGTHGTRQGDYQKFEEAKLALQKQGIAFTEKEVQAQETLVGALRAQEAVQEKVNELKTAQKGNAEQSTGNKIAADTDKAAREQAAVMQKATEEAAKLWEQNYREAVAALQENEREKIDATKQGSAERLKAINESIQEENGKGLQETGFYRSLLTARVELIRQMAEEQSRLQAEAGKEDAEHSQRMAELSLAAERSASQLRLSALRNSEQARLAEEIRIADEDFEIKAKANAQEIAALDKGSKDYENKLKALQDREREMVQAHENQITQIKTKAEEERNTRIGLAEQRMQDEITRGLSSVLLRHQTFTAMMGSLANQVASGLIENALKSILADDMTKPHDAAAAARKFFLAGSQLPFPANVIAAPALAAGAFATVMAFEEGGIVPGVGKGDIVPARLEPGEGVLTVKQMEHLKDPDASGGKADVHIHHHATYNVQAFNSDGVEQVLQDHGDRFTAHAVNTLRKMNR